MGFGGDVGSKKAVGSELTAVLPHDGLPWWKRGYLLKLNFSLLSLVLFCELNRFPAVPLTSSDLKFSAASANGYDGSLMNSLQALDQWENFMGKPSGAWLGWINAIYWLGAGIFFPIAAWLANKFGRKPGVYAGYSFLVLGSILQCAAPNDVAFILARFFVGCASALFGNAVPVLINEIAYPPHRGILNALFMCGWYVGGSVAAWVTFATRDYTSEWAWRLPSLLQLLLPVLALPGLLLAPESPRWLISVDRPDEAKNILAKAHAGGDQNSALVNYEFIEITTTIKAEQEAHGVASYADMVKTPGNRYRLFISISLGIFAQWAGNGVVSYYLSLVLDTVGVTSVTNQTLISACLQVWNLIFSVAGALSVDRLGRRPLFMASAVIMLISYVLVTALSGSFAETGNSKTGIAVIPFLFVFFAGYDIALSPFLTAYPCEIWPFRLRSRGLTVTWVASITAIFFNTFVNPIALATIGWKYYIVFVVVLLVMLVTVYFWYPETGGRSLEQIATIFDGEDAGVPDMQRVEFSGKEDVEMKEKV
ncbi:general substrate transporter [Pseudomassariella vexata]|uniref:General substrate transporter n=1 Tax=Pseudomassariella vexata TaxID=1141098 RepID=A0A1Y2DI12_9PEZI|nr:general substrate transporter [Pseudomassariella vexata]ORY58869.1 general substrate transporter [Pseudomassariella vexata]